MNAAVEQDFAQRFPKVARGLPHFADGSTDFTTARTCLGTSVFVMCDSKMLLLYRSDKVGFLKNRWHVVGGFLDRAEPVEKQALRELGEEIGVVGASVKRVVLGDPFESYEGDRIWIVYPVLLELSEEPQIKLDWEHTEYKWIDPTELVSYGVLNSVVEQWKKIKE